MAESREPSSLSGESQGDLVGKRVAVSGDLAWLPRSRFASLVRGRGGKVVSEPDDLTDVLVVGQESWPLDRTGGIDPGVECAQRLNQSGARIVILPEQEFLSGSPDEPAATEAVASQQSDAPALDRLYTTTQLSRILGISPHRLQAWTRQGLLSPVRTERRVHYYDFAQVSAVRVLTRLLDRGVTLPQIRRGLARLERWLPGRRESWGAGDSGVAWDHLEVHDGEVLVRLDGGQYADPSGQLHFLFDDEAASDEAVSFDAQEPSPNTVSLPTVSLPKPGKRSIGTARGAFARGVDCEEAEDLEGAASAYEEALDAGESHLEVLFNLGNVSFSLGRYERAYQCYLRVVKSDPDYVAAWNNLGNILAAEERWEEAIEAYREAAERSPDYPDPHYNLAEAYLAIGDEQLAWQHAYQYFRHDPHSPWAERLRSSF